MELQRTKERIFFELKPKGIQAKGIRFSTGRKLLGSSETCDLYLPFSGISPIHAVLEVSEKSFKIYDMNSRTGTFINGMKIVKDNFKENDILTIGQYEFIFTIVASKIEISSVLTKDFPPVIGSDLPPECLESRELPKAPDFPDKKQVDSKYIPKVEYPLSKDPNAEFSEYIFEDVEELYPIFKYDIGVSSIEVIILYQDRIYSVDYLPSVQGVYNLVGYSPKNKDIEYPYLGKKERCQFLEVHESEVMVNPLAGYECMILTDNNSDELIDNVSSISLRSNDIVRFMSNDIQVFVRRTDAPPKVKSAPFFRRDTEFKKMLVLSFFFLLLFLIPITLYQVDEELEDEKNPERIATILYKKRMKLLVSKTPAIEKTKKAPKIVQKSPQQLRPKKATTPEKKKQNVDKQKTVVKSGTKTAKSSAPAKKVTPRKAKITKQRNVVTKNNKPGTPRKKSVPKRKRSSRAARRTKSKGHVDTYKAINVKSTMSSVLAKGGFAKKVQNVATQVSDYGSSSLEGIGAESATSKLATVSTKTGSLTGTTRGKLDTSKGVSGLASKKSIYTVGVPAPEVLLGSMDPDVIRRILQDHIPQFRNCYQKALDKSKLAFDGVVPLNFVIGSSGHVTRAGVTGRSAMPGRVKKCVVNVLKGIQFPEPLGRGTVEVSQPMNFYPRH